MLLLLPPLCFLNLVAEEALDLREWLESEFLFCLCLEKEGEEVVFGICTEFDFSSSSSSLLSPRVKRDGARFPSWRCLTPNEAKRAEAIAGDGRGDWQLDVKSALGSSMISRGWLELLLLRSRIVSALLQVVFPAFEVAWSSLNRLLPLESGLLLRLLLLLLLRLWEDDLSFFFVDFLAATLVVPGFIDECIGFFLEAIHVGEFFRTGMRKFMPSLVFFFPIVGEEFEFLFSEPALLREGSRSVPFAPSRLLRLLDLASCSRSLLSCVR